MNVSRRDFLRLATASAGAIGLSSSGLMKLEKAIAGNADPQVFWLQGQNCTGCSVSFLNSIYYATPANLLINSLNLKYHSTLMVSAGELAMSMARPNQPTTPEIDAFMKEWLKTGTNLDFDLNGDNTVDLLDYTLMRSRGYILIVEGATPMNAEGKYCMLGGELSMRETLKVYAKNADIIIAIGNCGCYGGIPKGTPNPTGALGTKDALAQLGISKPIINIPGCPVHPDWLVGTISYLLVNGKAPALDSNRRPLDYFRYSIHDKCPRRGTEAAKLPGQSGCLKEVGCRGPQTRGDCYLRKWNSSGANQYGVNWCIGGNSPCHGCTEPGFPDKFAPIYRMG